MHNLKAPFIIFQKFSLGKIDMPMERVQNLLFKESCRIALKCVNMGAKIGGFHKLEHVINEIGDMFQWARNYPNISEQA